MSNYLSKPVTYEKSESSINLPLLNTVLATKQGKYDVAKEQIQQTLDAFGNIQVLRDQDKEYIAGKLSSITSDINGYGNRDLSQSGVSEKFMNNIKSAARDPFIVSAIEESYKMQSYGAQAQAYKKENKGGYNDINYQYGLEKAGYNEYMSGQTNKMGSLQYTAYTDYNKKINDFIIDLEGKKKEQTVQIQARDSEGNVIPGRLIEQKISGLNPTQLRAVAESMLDPNDLQQIQIDGWYNQGGYKNPNILTNIDAVLKADITAKDDRISIINTKLSSGGLSTDEKTKLNDEKDYLTQDKSNIVKNLDYLSKSPEAAATYLEKQKVINNTVNRFSSLYTESATTVKDDAYWAEKNYALDAAKFQYSQTKDTKKQQDELTGGDGVSGISRGLDLEGTESYEKQIDSQITQSFGELEGTLNSYRNALEVKARSGDSTAQEILNTYKKRLGTKTAGQTDNDVFRATVTQAFGTNSELSIIEGVNYAAQIKRTVDDIDLYTTGKENAIKNAKDQHIDNTLNTQEVFSAFNNNKNTKMLWKGVATPVHKILKSFELMDSNGNKTGDIKSNPELLKELQKSYYADDVLSNFNTAKPLSDSNSIEQLTTIFGEDPSNTVKKTLTGTSQYGEEFYRYEINPNTKTGQYLLQARQQGIYDTFNFQDQSLSSDDDDVNRFVKTSYREGEQYKNDLANFATKLPNTQQLSLTKDTNEVLWESLSNLAQSQDNSFNPDTKRAITIRQEGTNVILSQSQVTGSGDKKETTPQQVVVSLTDFERNVPEFAQRLNFDTQSAVYTYEKLQGRPLKAESIKYLSSNASDLFDWNAEVLLAKQPQFVGYLTASDSKATIRNNNMAMVQQYPETSNVINTSIENSSNYGVQIKLSAVGGTPKLYMRLMDKTSGEEIHSIKAVGYADADNFKEVLDSAPQVYHAMLINDILEKQYMSAVQGGNYESYIKLKKSLKIQ